MKGAGFKTSFSHSISVLSGKLFAVEGCSCSRTFCTPKNVLPHVSSFVHLFSLQLQFLPTMVIHWRKVLKVSLQTYKVQTTKDPDLQSGFGFDSCGTYTPSWKPGFCLVKETIAKGPVNTTIGHSSCTLSFITPRDVALCCVWSHRASCVTQRYLSAAS